MTDSDPFGTYVQAMGEKLATGDATERTHYPALEALLDALDDDVTVINEPQRIACGAPDFIVTQL